mmetsp:Transcript_42976/g.100829  ORF Transcript_42976/g.100829 Transcript_42976/m.100829 type:complete len:237 (-) Transcript_42976:1223-1933(-)
MQTGSPTRPASGSSFCACVAPQTASPSTRTVSRANYACARPRTAATRRRGSSLSSNASGRLRSRLTRWSWSVRSCSRRWASTRSASTALRTSCSWSMSRRRALEARTSRCSPDAPPRCASTGTARMTAPSAASSRALHSSACALSSSTSSTTFARRQPSRMASLRSRPQTTALPLATRPRASRAAISRRARAGRRSSGPSCTSAARAASFQSSRRSSWSGRRPATSCSSRILWSSS